MDGRRVPRAVWLVSALHLCLLLAYSVLAPTFRSPDEYVHVDLALEVADTWSYPDFDEQFVDAPIHRAIALSPAYQVDAPPVSSDDAPPRSERPSFADLGPSAPTDQVNPLPQHPPLWYGLAAGVLTAGDALPGELAFDQHVWLLRLFDIALVAPLPLLAWATASRLGASRPVGIAAAVAVLCVPSLTHIGSVVNNDNLVIGLGAVAMWLTARIVTGDRSWTTAVGAGLAVGLGMFTKIFAGPLAAVAIGAYAFAPGVRAHLGQAATRAAGLGAVAMAAGGWWWVRNLVVYGTVQPGVRLRDPSAVPVEPDVVAFTPPYLERVLSSFWGSFGWAETSVPAAAWIAATVVLVGLLAAAVAAAPGWGDRLRRLWMLVPVGILFAMVTSAGWGAFKKTGTPFVSQGRYLFAGLVGLVVVAVLGAGHLAGRRRRWWLPAATLAVATVLQALAVQAMLTRFWAGDSLPERVGSLVAFAPWPPTALAVVAAATALSLVATTADLTGLWPSRRHARPVAHRTRATAASH